MTGACAVQVTLWNSPYLGNFMSSELLLARTLRARLRLGTHFVLGDGAQGQPWLSALEQADCTWSVLPARRSGWRAHLEQVSSSRDAALLHAHFTAADLQAAAVASKAGVPCIWHTHTGFTRYTAKQRAKDLLKWRIIARRRVARIIVVAPWLAELAARRGAPTDRLQIVPNPIVLERFARLPDRAAARQRLGLDRDAEVVLGLGWWPQAKGVDVLLDALAAVSERRLGMQALLVGEEDMRSFIAQRLRERPRWLCTSGFVEDAAWLYAAADVFVSASRHEGQSYAVGEALACRIPAVISQIPGNAAWAEAPHVRTFASEDASALAAQLDLALADGPRERALAGAENERWVQSAFGAQAWCEKLCAIYQSLLARA